jgi:hypothetical protein
VAIPTNFDQEDYLAIDPTLAIWSKKYGVVFERLSKGYPVSSFWIEARLQLWIDAPDAEDYVRVHLAELKAELPSKWGRSINWRTDQQELADCLDQVWLIGQQWK